MVTVYATKVGKVLIAAKELARITCGEKNVKTAAYATPITPKFAIRGPATAYADQAGTAKTAQDNVRC